ncbi:MAG: CPBP family intramembrane metalloprotease [Spirochaetia bacterium]|nr:CPBP family intramembrane metalloprotease [Spirochaetia bacterium]
MNLFSLRNVWLFVMIAAVGFALYSRTEIPAARLEEMQDRQAKFMMKLLASQTLLSREAAESLKQPMEKQVRDQLAAIEKQNPGRSAFPIEKFILLSALGDKAERPPMGREDLLKDVDKLYFRSEPLGDDSPLFKLGSGDLARLYQEERKDAESAKKLRKELEGNARILEAAMVVFSLGAFGIFALGLVMTYLFFRRIPEVRFFPILQILDDESHRLMLEAAVIYMFLVFPVGLAFGKFAAGYFPDPITYALVHLSLAFAISVIYYIRSAGIGVFRQLLLPAKEDWFKEVVLGFLGFAAIFPPAIFALLLVLSAMSGDAVRVAHPIAFVIAENPIKVFILAAVLVPIFEEVVFRVFLYGYFRKTQRIRFAAFFSASVFAVLHPQGVFALPYLAILGMGLAALREYRNSPIASITAHACVNGFAVVVGWATMRLF